MRADMRHALRSLSAPHVHCQCEKMASLRQWPWSSDDTRTTTEPLRLHECLRDVTTARLVIPCQWDTPGCAVVAGRFYPGLRASRFESCEYQDNICGLSPSLCGFVRG